jgi:hypothetical protein
MPVPHGGRSRYQTLSSIIDFLACDNPEGSLRIPAIRLSASCGIAVRNYCTIPLNPDNQPPADYRAGQRSSRLSAAVLQTGRRL